MKTINEPTKLFNEVEFPSVTLKTKDKLDISHIPKKSQRRGIAMKQKQDENKGTPLMNPDRIKQKKEKSNFFENWDKVIRATSFTKPSTPYDFPNGSQDDRINRNLQNPRNKASTHNP
ncbi:MAG: hypothetical protein NT130_03510 [Candidatus Micrarchaeota archaeon]|nr:hypothetical protein [Candidatus Micrarchaeota archaeon]